MSRTAICPLSVIPMRAQPNDRSEMVSQMLLGESCDVIEDTPKWYKVITHFDNYTGWVDKKQVVLYDTAAYDNLKKVILAEAPVGGELEARTGNARFRVFEGSELFEINWQYWAGIDRITFHPQPATAPIAFDRMISFAHSMLFTPYLWGGRTRAGIDCSGFTQLLYKLVGSALHRDASMQAKQGRTVTIEEASPGDLAFFKNRDGHVSHTGMILENQKIIHASGYVRIDSLTNEGILNDSSHAITHSLHSIKRILI